MTALTRAAPAVLAARKPRRAIVVPSPLLVWLAVAPLALAVATLVDRSMLWVMLGVDATIAFVALADALWARRPVVSVRREVRRVLSIGRRNMVSLRIRSTADRRLLVRVTQDVFDDAETDELPLSVELPPGGSRTVRFGITPTRRGAYTIGDHFVRYTSPLGLWYRQLRIAADSPVRVYPDVQLVRTYERLAGQDRGQAMVRTRPRRGGESEFEQLREYIRGDPYRSVDWKATARRGKLISRQYQHERDQTLLLVLDAGRLMTAETDGISLFDHALNATLMLSHIALKAGDRVGTVAFDREIRGYVPPASGTRAMQHIIQSSYAIHPRLVASDYERALLRVATRIRKRTLFVLFTQVNDPVAAADLVRLTRNLVHRHLPLVVLFRDIDVDALVHVPSRAAKDDFTRAAAAELLSWRDAIIRQLEAAGVLVLDVRPGELTPRLVNAYLDVKTRRLL